ncbi:MAG: hypothetical protein IKR53_04950, partial [Clostridia bacterium]|nr:hypothetical protein [Clostridia bacterium]
MGICAGWRRRGGRRMIYTLYGKVFEVDVLGGYAVIECGGVGYKITVSANTLTSLPMPEFDAAGNV